MRFGRGLQAEFQERGRAFQESAQRHCGDRCDRRAHGNTADPVIIKRHRARLAATLSTTLWRGLGNATHGLPRAQ